ncbi:hypothetical protein, partial [Escherichia coli]|uniref:hypothetical protein n=1 Tax=Escherichia coli TaxID=562 RepID=UPI0012FF72DF
ADRNRSHWSTSKTPSYTKSVSWQHHQNFSKKNKTDFEQACKKLLDQTKPDNVYPINTNMGRFITSAEEALIEILNTIMLERT